MTRIAPRARREQIFTKPVTFQTADDPAVMAVARMVVAGVDKKYAIHPQYRAFVKASGKDKARELIESAVDIAGACDIIQTDMGYGGIGLFGGLSANRSRFTFYEWAGNGADRLSVSMTAQEARDIVSKKKTTVVFKPVPYQIRLCVDPFEPRRDRGFGGPGGFKNFQAFMKRKTRPSAKEQVYTKDGNVWALPYRDDEAHGRTVQPRYPDKLQVVIGGKPYPLAVSDVEFPTSYDRDKRIRIILKTPPKTRLEIREALTSDRRWRLRDRYETHSLTFTPQPLPPDALAIYD